MVLLSNRSNLRSSDKRKKNICSKLLQDSWRNWLKELTLSLGNLQESEGGEHLLPWKHWNFNQFMTKKNNLKTTPFSLHYSLKVKINSYWSSEATNENQTGPILLPCFGPYALSTACGERTESPNPEALFRRILRNFFGVTVSEVAGSVIFFSSSIFVLHLSSLFLLLHIWASTLGTWVGSNLESEPCELNFKDLVLFATSTKQFKGFQRSNFPSHDSSPFLTSLFMCWLGSAEEIHCFSIL